MLKHIRSMPQWREALFMAALTIFCLAFSLLRAAYTDTKMFLFLNWNLFLAFIPWALTTYAVMKPSVQKSKIKIVALLLTWLLFFPNAPYILTDLFHLRLQLAMPIWFDVVLVLSFAWTGLLFGFLSLWNIEQILAKSMRPQYVTAISVVLLFLASFGVYIGRYLRWNTWDVLTSPFDLAYDIGHRIIFPFHHPTTWGMTLFMGMFLSLLYGSFRLVRQRK